MNYRGRAPIADRFWRYVKRRESWECWLWSGSQDGNGYGVIGRAGGRVSKAHRVAYELLVAPIPDGLWVLHRCDVRACCNPAHLFLGTNADNVADMLRKKRNAVGEMRRDARLTNEAVRAIRQSNETQRVLADRYGVSQSLISLAKNGKIWRHA